MALDKPDVIDAIGIETNSGHVILTLADSWDWLNEPEHLSALQAKLNRYLDFIESGEILRVYQGALGRRLVIDVIHRHPISRAGLTLLRRAAEVGSNLKVEIRHRHHAGAVTDSTS